MKVMVWTVTSDTSNGTETTAHTIEPEAYDELKRRFVKTAAQDSRFEQYVAEGNLKELVEWVSRESERTGVDSFSVLSHSLEVPEQSTTTPLLDEAFREAANNEYGDEGRIEIDADAVVSHGDDEGAYVAAWVWVDRSDVPLCPCGARNDDGEGFNGLCGSCADKTEAEDDAAA